MLLLKRQFLARVHLVRARVDIAPRPDAALLPGRLVVKGEDRRVEVRKRVEIDETRTDQRIAVGFAARDIAFKAAPDKHDLAVLKTISPFSMPCFAFA